MREQVSEPIIAEACRARTRKEFVSKIRIVAEEADETQYWLELIIEADIINAPRLEALYNEAAELTAIFTTTLATARRNGRLK